MSEKRVPDLRFKGFSDDWEERKLGDHAKYRRGSFPQPYGNKEWYDGEGAMPFVQVVDVTNKLTLVENTKQKISKLAQSKSVFVPKGKVVVTLQGSIGRVAITQYDSFVDRTLLIFEDYEKETDERFWAYTIQKKFEIEKLKAPGGTIKTITKEALSSFDVHLPKFEEQQKIGSFFEQLDNTIALHQRKLELIKQLKQGFLQQMFVREDEKGPVLRFADFESEWEQRKLGEIAEIMGGGTPSTSNPGYWGGDIDWYSPVEIGDQIYVSDSKKKITKLGLLKSSARILPIGTVLFTSRAGIGNTAILAKPGATNQGFQSIVPITNKLDSYFIFSRTPKLKWYGEKNGAGSTFIEISGKQMAKMKIMVPRFEEQKKIGTLFQQLDQLITLHHNKLEQLQSLKKGYLKALFI